MLYVDTKACANDITTDDSNDDDEGDAGENDSVLVEMLTVAAGAKLTE